jgi:hypothetical protein
MGVIMAKTETIVRVVTAYEAGQKPSSIVVVIPRELKVKKGQKFLVKRDALNRLIYEPITIKEAPLCQS